MQMEEVADKPERKSLPEMGPVVPFIKQYWDSISVNQKKEFLKLSISEILAHLESKQDLCQSQIFHEAISFAEENQTWKFLRCYICGERFKEVYHTHLKLEHKNDTMISRLPEPVSDEWIQMILNHTWKPVNFEAGGSEEEEGSLDPERVEKLKRVQTLLRLYNNGNVLSESLLKVLIKLSLEKLQREVPALESQIQRLEATPMSMCYLQTPQLAYVSKYLEDLNAKLDFSFGSKKIWANRAIDIFKMPDGVLEMKQRIGLSGDSVFLILDDLDGETNLFKYCDITAADDGSSIAYSADETKLPDGNSLVAWVFQGPSFETQDASWRNLLTDQTFQGRCIYGALEQTLSKNKDACATKIDGSPTKNQNEEEPSLELCEVATKIMYCVGADVVRNSKMTLGKYATDYRSILWGILKLFLRDRFENLATPRYAAGLELLAEVAVNAQKYISADTKKKSKGKSKKKSKGKSKKKSKGKSKVWDAPIGSPKSDVRAADELKQEEIEESSTTELELQVQSRKLEEHLEHQRQYENELREKQLTKAAEHVLSGVPQNTLKESTISLESPSGVPQIPLEGSNMSLGSPSSHGKFEHVTSDTYPYQAQYEVYLYVIVKSLWHLRRLRSGLLARPTKHFHIDKSCLFCSLRDAFEFFNNSASCNRLPKPVEMALSNLFATNFYKSFGYQFLDAATTVHEIFCGLHESLAGEVDDRDCTSHECLSHTIFGMNHLSIMKCYNCGLETEHLRMTCLFHSVDQVVLRVMKIMHMNSSFEKLLKHIEVNTLWHCEGCRKLNPTHQFLQSPPHVFFADLIWSPGNVSEEDLSMTLSALSIEIDLGLIYGGIDVGNHHHLVSMVCFSEGDYQCFAYDQELQKWVMHDAEFKVIGCWDDVTTLCITRSLRPVILFFED